MTRSARVRRPDAARIAELASREFLQLSGAEADAYAQITDEVLRDYDRVDDLPLRARPLRHALRDPGGRPPPGDDPLNVFVRRCRVRGSDDGPLAGMEVGVKDNIAVAGVPLTDGSRLSPYVPTADAVVVERLLDGGADIVGMLNMDDHACGVLGETSAYGPPRNPHDPARSAGGSSGGSAAAVAAGLVDAGIGVDQGGSGRIPAAFCGVVALKPSAGLVPSHGITHLDLSFDSVSPIAPTVDVVARMLDAISGADDRDPQWARGVPAPTRCVEQLDAGVAGYTVGLVTESVHDGCEPAVVDGLDRAAETLRAAGADVVDVSIPLWQDARSIAVVLWCQLGWAMAQSEGQGFGHLGEVDVDRVRAFAVSRRSEADLLPPFAKVWLLLGRYMHEEFHSVHLARAQNLRREVMAQLNAALGRCDLLLTPTVPTTAPLLADRPLRDAELLGHAAVSSNTLQANLGGHPAVAVPSGCDAQGLPTSVQLIAPMLGEAAALRGARVVETEPRRVPSRAEGGRCSGPR